MQVPRIEKVTLNMGVGEAVGDRKLIENAVADLERLAGQKAVVTKARKSVAGFKIREGWPIGCKVTLRGERMWDFFDRLVDRKSTRLNSSHVRISYAVFCLKKKKKKHALENKME